MKTMVITGTTQGIGNELYQYYKDKYRVITINRRKFEGENYVCNLADLQEVGALIKELSRLEVDVLINNAGGAEPKRFNELEIRELVDCTNLNFHAPILLMQAVLENMKSQLYGRIPQW